MSNQFSVCSGAIALAAATAKIPLQFAPSAGKDAVMIGLDVMFDGSGTGNNCLVEMCTYGTVGSGGTTPTPTKYGQNQQVAASTVVRLSDTTAPTTITMLWEWYIPLNSGISYLWPFGREFAMVAGGKYCIRLTSPAIVNTIINAVFEE